MPLHFGNAIDMAAMLTHIPPDRLALGNINPADSIRKATLNVLTQCAAYPNFIISSGYDIPALSPWANIEAFFQKVADFYQA